jgi:putative selenium metabolism hydrolase
LGLSKQFVKHPITIHHARSIVQQKIQDFIKKNESAIHEFAQEIVRIPSKTCNEEKIAKTVEAKMLQLGFDKVYIDKLGNVMGVIGNGPKKVLFDSHMDTVAVDDADDWTHGPFSGDIVDGNLFGRGSVDMKSAVAATVYAGYAVKELGLAEGKTVYVSASVMEEDYDGQPIVDICEEIKPDFAIICEPSGLDLALGHKGRALLQIDVAGLSAHGSAPEKGVNPIYKAKELIARIEEKGEQFMAAGQEAGSLALTKIEAKGVSINAIPAKCSLYLDRRLVVGEDLDFITKEMEEITAGVDCNWSVYEEKGISWTGQELVLHSFLPAWEIDKSHHLAQSCIAAYSELNGEEPRMFKWDFCTNGVTPARLGIPTIGFGPGDPKLAHTKNENCPVSHITGACQFYANLVAHI